MKARFTLLFVIGVTGCAESSSLSDEFRSTPFRRLRGVELGMTGTELRRARPGTTFTPYLGLQERVPGEVVSYQFPSAMNDTPAKDIDPRDRLQGVFVTRMFDNDAAAASAWRESALALATDRRPPDTCEQFPTGGMQARWFSGKLTFAIGVFPREPLAPNVGPRVIYAVSPMETMKQPDGASPMACPTSQVSK